MKKKEEKKSIEKESGKNANTAAILNVGHKNVKNNGVGGYHTNRKKKQD